MREFLKNNDKKCDRQFIAKFFEPKYNNLSRNKSLNVETLLSYISIVISVTYSDVNLETIFFEVFEVFEFLFYIKMSPYWALYYSKILSES